MTTILKMTDCEAGFAQKKKWSLLHCKDQCTHKSFIMFEHDGIQKEVNKMKSKVSQQLMSDTFKDLFSGIEGLEAVEFLQMNSSQDPIVNKTQFNNPPVPRTAVPGNPCERPICWCSLCSRQEGCEMHNQEVASMLQVAGTLLAHSVWDAGREGRSIGKHCHA